MHPAGNPPAAQVPFAAPQGHPTAGTAAAHGPGPSGVHGPPPTPRTRPAAVAIACVLLWLYSAAMVVGGVLVIVWAIGLERPDPWSSIMPFVGEMFVVLFIGGGVAVALAGAVVAAFALAAFRGAPAARWVLAVIGTLGAIAALTGGLPLAADLPVVLMLVVAVALVVPMVLLFLQGSSAWLREVAQRRRGPRPGLQANGHPHRGAGWSSHPGHPQHPATGYPGTGYPSTGQANQHHPPHPGQPGPGHPNQPYPPSVH